MTHPITKFFKQTLLLLWKNWVLHIRNPRMTCIECLLPTLFAFVILILKSTSEKTIVDDIRYDTLPAVSNLSAPEIGFVPDTPATRDVMDRALAILCPQQPCEFTKKAFDTNELAVAYFKINSKEMNYIVQFPDVVSPQALALPPTMNYIIQPYRKINQMWHTHQYFMCNFLPNPRRNMEEHEFATFQSVMGRAIFYHWLHHDTNRTKNKADTPANVAFTFLRYPTLSYGEDSMFLTLKAELTLFIVLGFMLSSFVDTKNIVQEKESKIKEDMKLMGMIQLSYWISWFITCFSFLVPAIVVYTVVLGYDLTGKGPVLAKSDPTVVFTLLLCYCLALIAFSFLVSTFVQKANDGALAAGLLFLVVYVPYEVMNPRYNTLTKSEKTLACLSFNVALGFGNFHILWHEALGDGIQWSNIDFNSESDLTLHNCLNMLLLDTGLYLLGAWYMDNVFPGDFGVPKPFFFFLQRSYWCGQRKTKPQTLKRRMTISKLDIDRMYFDRDPTGLSAGIEIIELRKEFGKKVSVDKLTMKMYEGQITVLLGHNGAGKTTTMSMLTGFIPPTSGTAIIQGYDMEVNMTKVRKSLGLCPQHDILFDELTPKEHLWFFAKLKGCESSNLNEEIVSLISQIGLEGKGSYLVSKLSGGQQRSLSVGIALVGDSKVVILDEPSSGMDPSTRRLTWDLLKAKRVDRTILLSTHYMDEADALGDRIAIMADGKVQCWGTSMFLKKLYGTGYHLVIVKDDGCDVKALTQLIQSSIAEALFEYDVNAEVSYLLPDNQCHRFPALFRRLSENKQMLKILGFGTTATTMEEVFLRSEHVEKTNSESTDIRSSPFLRSQTGDTFDINELNEDVVLLQGFWLYVQQFKALFIKRFIVAWRHLTMTFLCYLCPAIFYLFYVFIDSSVVRQTNRVEPLHYFDISHYGKTTVASGSDAAMNDVLGDYRGLLGSRHDVFPLEKVDIPDIQDTLLEKERQVGKYVFNHNFIVGAVFSSQPFGGSMTPSDYNVLVLYNGEPYHAQFVSIDLALNALIQTYLGPSYGLTTGVLPLPKKGDSETKMFIMESVQSGFFVGLFIGIGMSIYSSMAVHFLLRERNSGVKHLHAVNRVDMLTYWLANFVWDSLSFVMPTIILFIIFSAFDKREFLDGNNWLLVILVIGLYLWSVLPCTYAVHFLFNEPSSGLIGVVIVNLFTILLSDMMVFSLRKPSASDDGKIGKVLDWVFSAFIPTFNLSQCFSFILRNHKAQSQCQPLQEDCERGVESLCCHNQPELCKSLDGTECIQWSTNYVEWDKETGIATYLTFMAIQGVLGCLAVFLIEYSLFTKLALLCKRMRSVYAEEPIVELEDDDVIEERERVLDSSAETKEKSLVMCNLHKKYGPTLAVDHICVAVSEMECFGLLGQSGAGKTTTFRMLTGATTMTSGNAFLMGDDVRTKLRKTQQCTGYCPQKDALIVEMTGRETLRMYTRLRGVPSEDMDRLVDGLLEVCLLNDFADRMCGEYSGGNKRKLSLAMALVGDPPFLLLDEPSCGMDPKARRQVWNVLSNIRAAGRTLVITSHNMEECDALCTRLAIMLNGRFVCIGSPQHLKNKYGQGYTLIIKMKTDPHGNSMPTDPVVKYIQESIPETQIFDEHQGYLHLHVPDTTVKLADVFELVEGCKTKLEVEDYSVHETTLEQIFLTFTKRQEVEEETVESCWFLQAGFFGDNLLCL